MLNDPHIAWPTATVSISTPALENRDKTSMEKLSVVLDKATQSTDPC
jgi:hypothetical protein